LTISTIKDEKSAAKFHYIKTVSGKVVAQSIIAFQVPLERQLIALLDPHFEEVMGGVEPWLMARWKARVDFLLSIIELLFYLLPLRRYKAKRVKSRCYQEGVGHFEPRFQGQGVVHGEYCLVSTN